MSSAEGKFAVTIRHIPSGREQSMLVDIMQGDPMEKMGRIVETMFRLVTPEEETNEYRELRAPSPSQRDVDPGWDQSIGYDPEEDEGAGDGGGGAD